MHSIQTYSKSQYLFMAYGQTLYCICTVCPIDILKFTSKLSNCVDYFTHMNAVFMIASAVVEMSSRTHMNAKVLYFIKTSDEEFLHQTFFKKFLQVDEALIK